VIYDLLVIGAGLSGLSAALAAAKAGLSVRIVAKGQGATHWHAGTIDLLGYMPTEDQPVQQPLASSQQLPAQHPYVLLGAQRLSAALESWRSWLSTSVLPYASAPAPDQNWWLPSPIGAPRPTWLAPQAQVAGDLSRAEPLLIVGFAGLRDFFPHLIAENLQRAGHQARAALLPLDLLTTQRDRNNVHLAAACDDPIVRIRLALALKKLHQPGERIGLPALLGLEQHMAVWQELESQVAASIFEIPTLPPSVPGIRLYHLLRQQLLALGVRIEVGMEVIGFMADGPVIGEVQSATSARPLRQRAKNFLLATGGILGGGFNSDHTGRCWETIFHLPLTVPQDRQQWFRHQFLHPQGQPVFQGGVMVNHALQPVDQAGNVIYQNLWAVGGLLAHADPIRERSLEGLAIATGIAAATEITNRQSKIENH
jgi:glycerol-3-phosphate dehydrogenase subunit B